MEKKTNRVQIRLPEEIYNIVESESIKYGISISEYIRICIVNNLNLNDIQMKVNTVNKKVSNILYQSFNLINMLNFLTYDKEIEKNIKNPVLAKEYSSYTLTKSKKEYENELSKMRNE